MHRDNVSKTSAIRAFSYGASLTLALLWLAPMAMASDASDGPYLKRANANGWTARWVEPMGEDLRARQKHVAAKGKVRVAAADGVAAFEVRLRSPAVAAADEVAKPPEAPLFVVADIHGEFGVLVELLQKQRVVDSELAWSFGQGHLVFLGDVFDRGAYQTEALWLIYKLEGEAAKAGGSVNLLLGNHEAMVLRGDVRYLNPKYGRTAEALGVASYSDLWGADSVLGQWLRTRSAVLKFNDLLLLHGGISPEFVERGLAPAPVNLAVREVLAGAADPAASERHDFAMKSKGPLWYRGYFPGQDAPAEASAAEVDAILQRLGVSTILVGHTPVQRVTPLYGGKVIAVQVYPKRDAATGEAVMGAVLRDKGRWYVAGVDGTREALVDARP